MTIVKQISLIDIQELFEMESSYQFDAILATFEVHLISFLKRNCEVLLVKCNYGAMIQSLIIRIVERVYGNILLLR